MGGGCQTFRKGKENVGGNFINCKKGLRKEKKGDWVVRCDWDREGSVLSTGIRWEKGARGTQEGRGGEKVYDGRAST